MKIYVITSSWPRLDSISAYFMAISVLLTESMRKIIILSDVYAYVKA